MNMTRRPELLARKRTELEDRLSRIRRDLHRAEEPAPADSGERAIALENDEVLDQLETSTQEELALVVHALNRIDAGKGEVCEGCGHPIEAGRLHAVPYTTRCRTCSGLGPTGRKRTAGRPQPTARAKAVERKH